MKLSSCRVGGWNFILKLGGVILALLLNWTAVASDFEDGNRLFHEGKFADAEQAYQRSLAKDGDSAATHHNLGKIREALADPAGAMLEWERAVRLDPKHVQAREALQLARNSVGSKVEPTPWWLALQPSFTRAKERWWLAASLWAFVFATASCLLLPRSRVWMLIAAIVSLLGAGGTALWLRHALCEAQMALVRDRALTLRAAPADPARVLDTLPLGSRVRMLDTSGGWCRVEAAGGEMGWVPEKSVERIVPAL